MDHVIRQVSELDAGDRRAFEHVLGYPLGDDQQILIGVQAAEPALAKEGLLETRVEEAIPDWWKVYEGLTDAEIDELDATIRRRAHLTRVFDE